MVCDHCRAGGGSSLCGRDGLVGVGLVVQANKAKCARRDLHQRVVAVGCADARVDSISPTRPWCFHLLVGTCLPTIHLS